MEFTDSDGRRRRETPKSGLKKDAEAIRKRIEREMDDGTFVAASQTVTVAALCDRYREHVEAKLRDGRIGPARIIQLDYHFKSIKKHLGSVLATDLTPDMIDRAYVALVKDDGLVPTTAKHRLYTLKMMQDFAVKKGLMVKLPADAALKELRGIERKPIRTFSRDDAVLLIKTASVRRPGGRPYNAALLECLVNLAAFCGLRYGEIIGLTRANVDLTGRMIHVRQSFCRYTVKLKGPKTAAGVRDVPMPMHVVALVRRWIETYSVPNSLDLVFTIAEGKWLEQSNFRNNMWLPLLKRAGLEHSDALHFHSLRHFAASWMIECGMPLTDVARIMGHSKFDMTLQVYAHPVHSPAHAREAIDRMADRFLALPKTIELPVAAPQIEA